MNKFELSESQEKKFEKWRKKKKEKVMAAIGGRFSFQFTPTGIGNIIKVICNADKTELDLTEWDNF